MKPRVIRKVTRRFKTAGAINGQPKAARDIGLGLAVEKIKAQKPRNCAGACIWGGTIEQGMYFARLDIGIKRQMGSGRNRRPIPVTEEYHFSCLPGPAQPLRRFFDPLPYKATLCRGEQEPVVHRLFYNIPEWEAYMTTHFPDMAVRWLGSGPGWRQHGTDYRWCRLDLRPSFRKR